LNFFNQKSQVKVKKFSIIMHCNQTRERKAPARAEHCELTLKMGSRMSWQKVLGSFFPSGLVADLLNLPVAGSKYLEEESSQTSINAQFSHRTVVCSACSGQRKELQRTIFILSPITLWLSEPTKIHLTHVANSPSPPHLSVFFLFCKEFM